MIGSIIFFGMVGVVIVLGAMIYDKCSNGHSKEYYRYLENNKVPPPEDRDEGIVLYTDLWGGRRR